ncbi:MAG: hypothetical protein COU07_02850 [Candidatus Harrisonbacteria bacterium CG10_big_fil_rev_8_21_14_0_10_40_38]|uniref:Uncharacterized protein n=1 Tax=Candidatus Harrisonbacteria bacterium CG10_big_fil_rev_8_21_14_0_10_40_38 TaxID=1974583 RepID=A0A2H0URV7_9BACT|nr:MAG: hypothetical protein COU07_02850 [Candidatus Harrisonbacteria bacterium CG10_big_fil_rev_8_21_14_0_10_40_38]
MKSKSFLILIIVIAVILGAWILLSSPADNNDTQPDSTQEDEIMNELDSVDLGADLDIEFQAIDEDLNAL